MKLRIGHRSEDDPEAADRLRCPGRRPKGDTRSHGLRLLGSRPPCRTRRFPGVHGLPDGVTAAGGHRLLISYEATTPSLFSLRGAAQGPCDIVWGPRQLRAGDGRGGPTPTRMGTVMDMSGCSPAQTVEALRATGPTGVVALNDRRINLLAEVAEGLELDFHTPEAARRLSDKMLQRQAMEALGPPSAP